MTWTSLSPTATSWPLVGRKTELGAIGAAMDDPTCGGVALVGPAGVGKSRLALHAAELAALRGLVTVSVRAAHSSVNIPFAALSRLFAELSIEFDALASPLVHLNEAIDRHRGAARLVLVVDDAQELDDASIGLLDQLVGREGVFVVLTVRTSADDALAVLDLWKDEQIVRMQIDRLDDAEIAQLVAAALGGPIDGVASRALVRACQGNVLFLRELVQGALESGALTSDRGMWRLSGSLVDSPRLRDLIDHRFRGLSDAERETLELVALGEPLRLPLLTEIVPLDLVERLERRGLLAAVPAEGASEVRLAHPLYGEAVRARLSPIRRARLCRELADAADRGLGAPTARGTLDELRAAVWHLDGGGGGSPEAALIAARTAFRSEDFELAARLSRSAWEHGRLIDAALLLADALDVSHGTVEAEAVLRDAYSIAESDEQRSAVAVRLASTLFVWSERSDEADEVLTRCANSIVDVDCLRLVTAQRADLCLLRGEVAVAIELDRTLLEGARDRAHAQASRDLGVGLALSGRSSEALALTEAALAIHFGLADSDQLSAIAVYVVAQALALLEAGRLAEAHATGEAAYAVAIDRRNLDGQGWFACILGLTSLAMGRLTEADHLFKEATTVFSELGHPGRRWGLGGMALAAAQLGRRDDAVAAVAELDALSTAMRIMDVHVERGRAWAAISAGDLATARSILWAAVAMAESWGQYACAAAALHDLVRVGEGELACARLESLADLVDGDLMAARVAHAVAVRTADVDAAATASAGFEATGALLLAAEAAVLEVLLADAAGLRRRAAAARERSDRLLARCSGTPRTPALSDTTQRSQLSVREREVAMLAVEGLASKEIADRLFVSIRTVDNHLQRIYQKLGVSSRSELAEQFGAVPRP